MRKTSTGSEPGSPMVPSSPKPQSPSTPPFGDQEEVYKSLRRTTAEIQNYSFETLGMLSEYSGFLVSKYLTLVLFTFYVIFWLFK